MRTYTCYTDGGYDNVRKRNGYGSFRVITDTEDVIVRHRYPHIHSSNEAEYETFIDLLRYLELNLPDEPSEINVISDSKLMVNQINGIWKVGCQEILVYYKTACTLMANIKYPIILEWRPRKVLVKELGH